MRIVTYMGFTLLSILTQFCVMDFIQEKLQKDDGMLDLNVTRSNEDNYKSAISVRDSKQIRKIRNLNIELKKNVNSNITKLIQSGLSTEMTSTIMDIFYDDNASTTDFSFSTELFLSTEVDNVTEINFPIEVKPLSKPDIKPKNIIKDCECDLMYEICDINCCCDSDCTDEQKHLFPCNEVNNKTTRQNDGVCYAYLFHNDERYKNGIIDNMLCIVKVNLPEQRKLTHKYKESLPHHHYKWRSHNNLRREIKFSKDVHKIGDPIWLLRNQSINHIDLPSPLINDYCNKRKPMGFLREEEIKCIVKLKDLEMFHIYNLAEQTKIISVKNVSANSSSLNCSSLYCANWTILVCNEMACEIFNKSIHEPTCSENICTNIALMVDYIEPLPPFYRKRQKPNFTGEGFF